MTAPPGWPGSRHVANAEGAYGVIAGANLSSSASTPARSGAATRMPCVSTWTDIDERVLRWLLDQDSNPNWDGRSKLVVHGELQPFPDFNGELDSRQVDEALRRLRAHGLIAGERSGTVMVGFWSGLRLTSGGLILVGEWPDLDRVASIQGLQVVIARLAEQAEDASDSAALRRTAGAIGRLSEGLVNATLESLGEELAGG